MFLSAKPTKLAEKGVYPLIPMREVVIFPGMSSPVQVQRSGPMTAIDDSLRQSRTIIIAAQKDPNNLNPTLDHLFDVGVRANASKIVHTPDGNTRFVVDAVDKVKISNITVRGTFLMATAERMPEDLDWERDPEILALSKSVAKAFSRYLKATRDIVVDDVIGALNIDNPIGLVGQLATGINTIKVERKQAILEEPTIKGKLKLLYDLIEEELNFSKVDNRIRERVSKSFEKQQRQAYLNEQLQAIQKELGDADDENEVLELEKKIDAAGFPKEALLRARSELKKLRRMHLQSSEAAVSRNYLETMLELPWHKRSPLNADIAEAAKILDSEHYALDKVKDRILEFLAVQKRTGGNRGSILCLMGPPGVGKTSLGQAIAKATGRVFEKVSLGGVKDEGEIRGHRRTYIGSQCGKILAAMKKAGTTNPLVMLDEIDKMGTDSYHGDPASAMLEVLDPEQNHAFDDHYLDLDYDLSGVMFIATANTRDIPKPLLDRMEVIDLEGYTEEEKLEIARRHIIPKLLARNGLAAGEISFGADALREIIRHYTRESGVRELERQIDKVMRKAVKSIVEKDGGEGGPDLFRLSPEPDGAAVQKITSKNARDYLGVRKYEHDKAAKADAVGSVHGLAWTSVGGEILTIEAVAMQGGSGKNIFTGKLGDVMKESIEAAKSFVRAHGTAFGIEPKRWEKLDLHIHVPEGATPKDGPSAGVAMAVAMASAMNKIPVRHDTAMTGEITLQGKVLAIGGLKEKLLAALRSGIKRVLIPFDNVKDLDEIPAGAKEKLEIIPVKTADEALGLALSAPIPPLPDGGTPDFAERLKEIDEKESQPARL